MTAALLGSVLLLVACGEPPAPLTPIKADAPDAPVIQSMTPAEGTPAGGEPAVIAGERLAAVTCVWIGNAAITDLQVKDEGRRIEFKTPKTSAGATLDVAVGVTDAWGETIEQRVVAKGAFRTSGLPRAVVALLGVVIAILALLGAPLFIVISAATCLGWYLQAELTQGVGFFTRDGGGAGLGTDLFIAWLKAIGDSPLFIAIPLFTFAGTLMSDSRTPARLIALCRAALGWMPGGLALVTILTCAIFTAFTGASGVTIIALGGLLYPVLLREKYPQNFTLGLLTSCGSLGLLFPPSLPVIVYGLIARVDVGRLFQAALIPGLVLCGTLFIAAVIQAVRSGVPRHPFDAAGLLKGLKGCAWELPLPVIVIGGIYGGLITAAEASAVTAVYVLIITMFVHKDISPKNLMVIIRKTCVLSGAILIIIGTALGLTNWLTIEQVPQVILGFMQSKLSHQTTFLLALNLFLLVVHIDIFSATLVVLPLILPVAAEFGVDPYHLAVIFLVNLEIGYSTPPIGINLFLAALRFRRSVLVVYGAATIFIPVLLATLALITYVPALTLCVFSGLPRLEVNEADVRCKEGEAHELKASTWLGDLDLEAGKARLVEAQAALAAKEKETGLVWADLEAEVRRADSARSDARTPDQKKAAAEAFEAAKRKQAPLVEAETRQREASRKVQALTNLARTVKWRSRTTGQEASGPTFDASTLAPGDHVVTATAKDERGHLAQQRLTIHVDPKPADPSTPPPGEKKEEDWGWEPGTEAGTEKR